MKTVNIGGKTYAIFRSSEVIEATGKTGQKFWQGHVVQDNDGKYYTCTSSWKATKDGGTSKVMWSEPYYAEPKSLGRSNETTNAQQANAEFESMVQKEKDKRLATRPMPMLAHTFINKREPKKSRQHKIHYPAGVQPKFDGMRMLYDGTTGWSRGNKEIIPAVLTVADVHFDTQGHVIDGELLLPENPKVSVVMAAVKKVTPGLTERLIYRVYDVVDAMLPFSERLLLLASIVEAANNSKVILAQTEIAQSEEEVLRCHAEFVKQGFEGSIIRNLDGKYDVGHRSDDLQKHKDWEEGEYKIINIIPSGGGLAADVGKFVCVTDEGVEFESTPVGPVELRRKYLAEKHTYIGKWAKVKFRELTVYRAPFHSNMLEVRDTKEGGY